MTAPARTVVAVASGKGGVGKSTVALNLALALSRTGQSVGLLDADLYGPDIPVMMGITRRIPGRAVTLARKGAPNVAALERHGIRVMSSHFYVAEDQALAWYSGLAEVLLSQLMRNVEWGDLDFLIIDLPPGTADVQQKVSKLVTLTGAIVVVTPQDAAHLDAKKVIAMFEKDGVAVLGGVENMAGLACPHCGERVDVFPPVDDDRSIWHAGVERLASIPMDPAIAAAGDRGRPVVIEDPDGPQAAAFAALAARLLAFSLQ